MKVSVPASSANLGPGFDALGVALDLPFLLSTVPEPGLLSVEPSHPARVAFDAAGGDGGLWWRSSIPPGRGLGFSGAARAAGALLGTYVAGSGEPLRAFDIACELEGHPENAAASMLGGFVACAAGRAVRFETSLDLAVVVWWPDTETSTRKARAALPPDVPFEDAVFNIGHTALLVAALAAGDAGALRDAMEDRLHQDARLSLSPASRVALDAALAASPIAAWLSGSGPTVAAFAAPDDAPRVAAAMPAGGTSRILSIDRVGAVVSG